MHKQSSISIPIKQHPDPVLPISHQQQHQQPNSSSQPSLDFTHQTLTKKIKLTPDQLTKIKSASEVVAAVSPLASVASILPGSNLENSINSVAFNEQQQQKSDADELYAQLEFFTPKAYEFHSDLSSHKIISFESLVKMAIKTTPIILEEYYYYEAQSSFISRPSKSKLPFAAASISEFYSWPYAKRKANEWMRALSIRRKCIGMAVKARRQIEPWTTKQILLWLRARGHSPLEYHQLSLSGNDLHENSPYKRNNSATLNDEIEYVDSHTSITKLTGNLTRNLLAGIRDQEASNAGTSEDQIVDIESEVVVKDLPKNQKTSSMADLNDYDELYRTNSELSFMKMSAECIYAQEQLNMVSCFLSSFRY
jgi:hypothetical protein